LTLGVFGGYGSGKTTLMQAIRRDLGADPGEVPPVTVWFNAWRYDHERHLFLPFLAALEREGLVGDPVHKKSLELAFRSFLYGLKLKAPFLELSIDRAIDREKELTEEEQQQSRGLASLTGGYVDIPQELGKLSRLKDGGSRRIVVFIDDLDRCVPSKAFQLLEAMKAFTDIEGFLFVVGLDPRVISRYLDDKFAKRPPVTAEEYLEKLFQVAFQIPEPTTEQITALLPRLKTVLPEPTGKVLDEAVAYLPRSLRRIKRLLNAHQVLLALAPQSSPELLLALLILQDLWPGIYGMLYSFGADFLRRLAFYRRGGDLEKIGQEPLDKAVADALKNEAFVGFYRAIVPHVLPDDGQALEAYLRLLGKPKEKFAG